MASDLTTITTLHNLLDYDARKFIGAEVQLEKVIPAWISKSGSLKLKTVLQKYLGFIELNVKNFETFISDENISSLTISNRIMQAFIDETEEKLSYCSDAAIKDACILAAVQEINHFKISAYGTAAAFANALDMEKAAAVFHEAEIKEKQIDDRLSQLAEHEINIHAKTPIILPG